MLHLDNSRSDELPRLSPEVYICNWDAQKGVADPDSVDRDPCVKVSSPTSHGLPRGRTVSTMHRALCLSVNTPNALTAARVSIACSSVAVGRAQCRSG